LREIGMIDTQFEGSNRRTKFLAPTPLAVQYFQTHSKVMDQAMSQTH
jgi:hypothetical protein